jgi:hypothetical protein
VFLHHLEMQRRKQSMNVIRLMSPVRFVLAMTGTMSLLVFAVHAEQSRATSCSCPNANPTTTHATPDEVKDLPRHGRVRSETAPPKAVFGMIWNDTKSQREYIFDGNEWVPHDDTVDDYYASKKAKGSGAWHNGGGR